MSNGVGDAHRVDDVLPLGSISNVHGIVSNGHHMNEPGAELFLSACAADRRPRGQIARKPVHRRFSPTARELPSPNHTSQTVQQNKMDPIKTPLHASLLGS